MTSRGCVVAVVAAMMAIALTGCSASGLESPPTHIADGSGRATATRTESLKPTSTSPPPVSPSVNATAEPGGSAGDEMSAGQAAEICLRSYGSFGPAELRSTPSGEPRTYERNVEPHWLVLIPAVNKNGLGYIECRLGGSYSDPVVAGVGDIAESVVTEEYIQRTINENDGL